MASSDPATAAHMPVETAPTEGVEKRIVFSAAHPVTDVPARIEADGTACFSVDSICVGEGETLVMQAAGSEPIRVKTALLETADGARLTAETFIELYAERVVCGAGSVIELVGEDGRPGRPGADGRDGPPGERGEHGGRGEDGSDGQPGGGTLYFGRIEGTLTVVAGGGCGGDGGAGGRGGHLAGGDGGDGGHGGQGGDGGTVVIRYQTIAPGGAINLAVHVGKPGAGGAGGEGGYRWPPSSADPRGAQGADGACGAEGRPPSFSLRQGH